jgi:hypothetical protein
MPSVLSRDWNLNLNLIFLEFFFRFNGTKFSTLFSNKYRQHKIV